MLKCQAIIAGAAALLAGAAASAETSSVAFTEVRDLKAMAGNAEIGTLHDVIVTSEGRPAQLLIGRGGLLGLGQTLIVIDRSDVPSPRDGAIHLGDGEVALERLREYHPETPQQAPMEGAPPVSGANQQAGQTASTYVPVERSPSPAPAAGEPIRPDQQPPARPSPDTAQEAEQNRVANRQQAAQKAQVASSNMSQHQEAPSQSAAATAAAPPPAAGAGSSLNQEYGRDTAPAARSSQAEAGGASTRSEAASEPLPRVASDGRHWRIGKIVGATVRGQRDGIRVKDVRFDGSNAGAVILADGGGEREVPFAALILGGTAEEPLIALRPLP